MIGNFDALKLAYISIGVLLFGLLVGGLSSCGSDNSETRGQQESVAPPSQAAGPAWAHVSDGDLQQCMMTYQTHSRIAEVQARFKGEHAAARDVINAMNEEGEWCPPYVLYQETGMR